LFEPTRANGSDSVETSSEYYFDDLAAIILSIINRKLGTDQPKYLASLLKEIYEVIQEKSRLAEIVSTYDLRLVGNDSDQENLKKVLETLRGLNPFILVGDIRNPELIIEKLEYAGISDTENILFIHYDADFLRPKASTTKDAVTFLDGVAKAGFFPNQKFFKKYSQAVPLSLHTLNLFEKRAYVIRGARIDDLQILLHLEDNCWTEGTRSSAETVKERLTKYPEGQLVLEAKNKVVGVIYSQRIDQFEALEKATCDTADQLHIKDGGIIQLIAINILPEMQEQNLGDQLLEYMLQRCTLAGGVETVLAVTRCKGFARQNEVSFQDYIHTRNDQGTLVDPLLRFHELHGAVVKGAIADYRPADTENKGYGVLVSYDIQNRSRNDLQLHTSDAGPIEEARMSMSDLQVFLEDTFKDCLGRDNESAFSFHRPLLEMGFDSLDLLGLIEKISHAVRLKLEPTFFFQYYSADKVFSCLLERLGHKDIKTVSDSAPRQRISLTDAGLANRAEVRKRDGDVAIIGAACRLPGGISTPAKLWDCLKSERSVIGEMPEDRWNWPDYINPDNMHKGINLGGFLGDISNFDASFFRISPTEVESMDPQQRIMLELSWLTMEDAGYPAAEFADSRMGVFMGVSGSDYSRLMVQADIPVNAHMATGCSTAVLANRISYFYDFHGPSLVIDTSCSSSLVAVHKAIQSLRMEESSLALVGGINLMCHPANSIAYYKSGMLASDGKCKTFDRKADGYVRSEGAVMVLLKPLERAVADQDLIYAVIKGSASNHAGQAGGLTVPNPEQQAKLLLDAWQKADVTPDTISYIETHGTGTSLGDPIEINGLKDAFARALPPDTDKKAGTCGLGSIKTNLGHLEAASGIAGLLKTALCLQHKELVSTLHFEKLNDHISLIDTPFYIINQSEPWLKPQKKVPRRAGVSNFGSGGTNAHVVLEEYSGQSMEKCWTGEHVNKGPFLFVLSARDKERLKIHGQNFLTWLRDKKDTNIPFESLTYTLQTARQTMEERLALIVSDWKDLIQKLEQFCSTEIEQLEAVTQEDCNAQCVNTAIQQKDLEQLAVLWGRGACIDWKKLYPDPKPCRISIPTYPFAKGHYWISETDTQTEEKISPVSHQDRSLDEFTYLPIWEISHEKLEKREKTDQVILLVFGETWHKFEETVVDYYQQNHPAATVIQIRLSHETRQVSEQSWLCDVTDSKGLERCLKAYSPVSCLYFIAGCDGAQFHQYQYTNEFMLLRLVKLLQQKIKKGDLIDSYILRVNDNPTRKAITSPCGGGTIGLAFAITQGDHRFLVRNIDLSQEDLKNFDPSQKLALFKKVYHEPPAYRGDVVKLQSGFRYKLAFCKLQWENYRNKSGLKKRGVYIILGGSGTLGMIMSRYLIGRYQARVIWIGRKPETSSDIRGKIASFERLGVAPPWYIQADATRSDDMAQAVKRVRERYDKINGAIFSGAVYNFENSVEQTTENEFQQVLDIKIQGSHNFYRALKEDSLDFMCFFSSIQSFSFLSSRDSVGYATGTTCSDVYVKSIQQNSHFPIGIINWGYWEESVRGTPLEKSLTRHFDFISGAEGFQFFEQFSYVLQKNIANQVLFVKARKTVLPLMNCKKDAVITFCNKESPSLIQSISANQTAETRDNMLQHNNAEDFDKWMAKLLLAQMQDMGIFSVENAPEDLAVLRRNAGILEKYDRWFQECCVEVLTAGDCLRWDSGMVKFCGSKPSDDNESVWREWESHRNRLVEDPQKRASVLLADTCLKNLPEILRGTTKATDIIFPNSSMEMVEGMYKGNPISDHFNSIVAGVVKDYIKQRIETDPEAKIRIIEIGAGTGGTTSILLPQLSPFQENIQVYCYTDISKAFLLHGEEYFGAEYPFLEYKLWNVEQPVASQGIEIGAYDIVIATNVLHATKNIRQTLRNTKAVLRRNGILILNEIIQKSVLTTLTFGLLDGWWLSEDEYFRIPGSPLLNTETWQEVLAVEGFQDIIFPVKADRHFGQQIIVAESDGRIRSRLQDDQIQDGKDVLEKIKPSTPLATFNDTAHVTREFVTSLILDSLSLVLKIARDSFDQDTPFSDFGVDSILGSSIVLKINERLGIEMNPAIIFDYTTVNRLTQYVINSYPNQIRMTRNPDFNEALEEAPCKQQKASIEVQDVVRGTRKSLDLKVQGLAVIGMSGQFPGAGDVHAFWDNLIAGKGGRRELPPHYLDQKKISGKATGKPCYRWGGILADRDCFDPLFFQISPREANLMNPHQRLILQEAWRGLEDAGYNPKSLADSRVGMFIGAEPTEYAHESFTGYSDAITASRLSYYLDLKGPALVVNTGCSSSGVAIHLACDSLRNGESNIALAGGVFAAMNQTLLTSLSEIGMLSPTGQCRPFDTSGNGTVLSEGVGIVVLKRLGDAIDDGDSIYGIIEGSGINQDGASNGMTAPNGVAQETLICDVYRKYGINPEEISYIEAHGTGTKLGDPVEVNALTRAYRQFTDKKHYCALGTAKAHIGHTAASAGVIGLIKILLSMKHRQIPGLIHFKNLNHLIELQDSAFYVNRHLSPWRSRDNTPLMAALDSFGHSGTNVHLVVKEYVPPFAIKETQHQLNLNLPVLIPLSAKTEERLKVQVEQLLRFLELKNKIVDVRLADLAYTLQTGREEMKVRVVFLAKDLAELIVQLIAFGLGKHQANQFRLGSVDDKKAMTHLFDSDEDSMDMISRWIAKGKHNKLAELWTHGIKIDWNLFYGSVNPRRISLPTYPFARERYGLTLRESEPEIPESGKQRTGSVPEDLQEGLTMLTPLWNVISSIENNVIIPDSTAQLMIAGGTPEQRRAIQEVYPKINSPEMHHWQSIEEIAHQLKSMASVDHIIWIVPDDSLITLAYDTIVQAQDLGTLYLFRIIKALLKLGYGTSNLAWTVITTQSQAVRNIDRINPTHAGIHGLVGALAKEYPHWKIRLLDMEATGQQSSTVNDWPIKEMFRLPFDPQGDALAYRGEQWFRQSLVSVSDQANVAGTKADCRSGGVYVVIGGAGGIGEVWSRYMVEKYQARIIWVGRREKDAAIQGKLESLSQHGPSPIYIQADAADQNSLQAAYDKIKQTHGRIHGLVHSAIVLSDQGLANMDENQFQQGLRAKVDVSVRLAQVFQKEPLDFVLFFSAMQSFIKAPGQSNYAAGCTFKDAFAQRLSCDWSCAVKIVNWGYWGTVGIVADPFYKNKMKNAGFGSIEPDEAMDALETFLQSSVKQMALFKPLGQLSRTMEMPEIPCTEESDKKSDKHIKAIILEELTEFIKVSRSDIDHDATFSDYGIDSITGIGLIKRINDRLGVTMDMTALFDHSTVDCLTEHVVHTHKDQIQICAKYRIPASSEKVYRSSWNDLEPDSSNLSSVIPDKLKEERPEPSTSAEIAIIGISGQFPGAEDVDTFWKNLIEGKDSVSELPSHYLDQRKYFSADGLPGKTYCKWGGILEGRDCFDPHFFNISHKEAESMNPHQRLILQETWRAFEDAGYNPRSLEKSHTGMFIGAEPSVYSDDSFTGSSEAIVASRFSFYLNLKGPAMVVNTGCSSSGVAIHLACESLRHKETTIAVAGGVFAALDQKMLLKLSPTGMLTRTGRCHTFDESADGIAFSEGVGVVILKRLDDAIADGDPIHGIIQGSGTNQNGRSNGITAPNGTAEEELIASVYRRFAINPEDVSYVEAHGTGTSLGDSVEANAVVRAFRQFTKKKHYCSIESVKSHIGHTAASSGVIGLIKIVLSMRHRKIPGLLNFKKLNSLIQFQDSPFYLNTQLSEWGAESQKPLMAALNTFGHGGSNVHLVIKEYIPSKEVQEIERHSNNNGSVLIPLSAKTETALNLAAKNLWHFLDEKSNILNIAYTLQIGREEMKERVIFLSRDVSELKNQLKAFTENEELTDRCWKGSVGQGDHSGDEDTAVIDGDYKKIAQLWTRGCPVDWDLLYGKLRPQRINLPTYPFARTRYGKTERSTHGSEAEEVTLVRDACCYPASVPQKGTDQDRCLDVIQSVLKDILLIRKENELDKEATFIDVGLDSIRIIPFIEKLSQKFNLSLRETLVFDYPTLSELAGYIAGKESQTTLKKTEQIHTVGAVKAGSKEYLGGLLEAYDELVPLEIEGKGPLLFCIHPMSGDVGYYSKLAKAAEQRFCLIGIKARGFLSGKRPLTTIKSMAEWYAEMISAIDPKGPYYILGSSLGGTIAYETTRRLQMQNKKVRALFLVEPPLIECVADEKLWVSDVTQNWVMNANFLMIAMLHLDPDFRRKKARGLIKWPELEITYDQIKDVPEERQVEALVDIIRQRGARQTKDALIERLKSQAKIHLANLNALRSYRPDGLLREDDLDAVLFRTHSANAVSKDVYNPDYLIKVQQAKGSMAPFLKGWERLLPQLETVLIEGENHFDILGKENSVQNIADFIAKRTGREAKVAPPSLSGKRKIAIIGMSGQFPGGKNLDDFWRLLRNGESAVTEFPQNRDWTPGKIFDTSRLPHGGFLEDIDCFDPLFFNISPKEADMMDPSERFFLQESWKAIEDAGIVPAGLSGKRCGVYCGGGGDYTLRLKEISGISPHVTASSIPGRVSYTLNLKGPCISVDAGCASSGLAIVRACDDLILSKCDVAIAGGVLVHSTPNLIINSDRCGLLSQQSKHGQALDAGAEGMLPGEAVGVLVLKMYDEAMEDGDRIHGVIEGWGSNHNGKTNGMAAPSVAAQEALFAEVYAGYEINPETITMMEANATGTPLGDSIEVQALTSAFRKFTGKQGYCSIGSVENNVGHAFQSSGMSHIMKVLLALRHKEIPGSINIRNPNPLFDISNTPFFINTEVCPWKTEGGDIRRAAVNSFGGTGINVHLILSEPPVVPLQEGPRVSIPSVICLSAKTKTALKGRCLELKKFLDNQVDLEPLSVAQLAANLLLRRSHFSVRCSLVVDGLKDLEAGLSKLIKGADPEDGVYTGAADGKVGPSLKALGQMVIKSVVPGKEIEKENLLILADLYVKGIIPNFQHYFTAAEKFPLTLPTYPFDKRPCWVNPSHENTCPGLSVPGKPQKTSSKEVIIQQMVMEMTGHNAHEVDMAAPLSRFGVDSLMSMRLIGALNEHFSVNLQLADLLEHNTIKRLVSAVEKENFMMEKPPISTNDWFTDRLHQLPAFLHVTTLEVEAYEIREASIESGKSVLTRLLKEGIAIINDGATTHFVSHASINVQGIVESLSIAEKQDLFAGLPEGTLIAPVSQEQVRNLYHSEIMKQSAWNVQHVFELKANHIDLRILNQAMAWLVRKNDSLRTCYFSLENSWGQFIAPEAKLEVQSVEMSCLTDFQRFLGQRRNGLLDVEKLPIFHAWISKINEKYYLGFVTHHSLSDAFTLTILFSELMICYHALLKGKTPALKARKEQYWQYCLQQFHKEVYKSISVREHWREVLTDRPVAMRLPYTHDPQAVEEQLLDVAACNLITLPSHLSRDIGLFSQEYEITFTQLFTTAVSILLVHGMGNSHAMIRFINNQRDRGPLMNMLGEFTNILFVPYGPSEIDPEHSAIKMLQEVRRKSLNSLAHSKVDFTELLAWTSLNSYENYYRQSGDVMVNSADIDAGTLNSAEDYGRSLYIDTLLQQNESDIETQAVATLFYQIVKVNQQIHLVTSYRKHLFDQAEMRQLSDLIVRLVEEVVRNPEQPVKDMLFKMKDSITALKNRAMRHMHSYPQIHYRKPPIFTECQKINGINEGVPVFWVHGGFGDASVYIPLAQKIKRPFYGIQARGLFDDKEILSGVKTIAEYYRSMIQSIQGEGPYDLGGYSIGGVLAYEVAQQLQSAGQSVHSLTLVDPLYPPYYERLGVSLYDRHYFVAMGLIYMSFRNDPSKSLDILNSFAIPERSDGPQENFLESFVSLCIDAGVRKPEEWIRNYIKKMVAIHVGYNIGDYAPPPLIKKISYLRYFKNRDGLFFGDGAAHMNAQEGDPLSGVDYWSQWKHLLPGLDFQEVIVDNHLMLFEDKVALRTIGDYCARIYHQESKSILFRDITPDRGLEELENKATSYFKQLFSSTLKGSSGEIDARLSLKEYGLDSLMATQLTSQLQEVFGPLSITIFFEYQTIAELTGYFLESHREEFRKILGFQEKKESVAWKPTIQSKPFTAPAPEPETMDIAIIGLSGRYPGAGTLEAYWEILRDGVDCITEVPENRPDWLSSTTSQSPGGPHAAKWGGFIEDVDKFDPLFFNISPKEAELMDPQERLFLEHSWKAMEDAGYCVADLQGGEGEYLSGQVSVYAGVMYREYQLLGLESYLQGNPLGPDEKTYASVANRVSYTLNLHGPSMAVDSACSSSLTCLYLACQDLKYKKSDLAFAGGVNLCIHPAKYHALSMGGFMSSRGRCESFGEQGNGFIPGEGVGVVLLKRLADAERDGDHIYGVIKGLSVNHGGKTSGYTVPNPKAQQMSIERALDESRIDPRRIRYIEAHGTGTKLGDPIEISGLTKAFQKHTLETQYCWVGSVKSNIGHGEAVAGIAGLTKVLLQMKHGQIVPSLHSSVLNPHIDFAATPFMVNQKLRKWDRPNIDEKLTPRVAGVSSFGGGGSNAHLIIEEHIPKEWAGQFVTPPEGVAIILSAKNEERLKVIAENLLNCITDKHEPNLLELAYTLQIGREGLEERLGFIARSFEELKEKLQGFLGGSSHVENYHRGRVKRGSGALDSLASADEFQEAIDKWLQRGNLSRLLDLWVKGIVFDWKSLYGETKLCRISLPTYPFAREEYWIQSIAAMDATTVQEEETMGTFLYHPYWRNELIGGDEVKSIEYAQHIVALFGLESFSPESMETQIEGVSCVHLQSKEEALEKRFQDISVQAFNIIKKTLENKFKGKTLIQIVIPASEEGSLFSGLSGLLKTAQLENPNLIGQFIAVEQGEPEEKLLSKLKENCRCPEDTMIRYIKNQRQILVWKELVGDAPASIPWKDKGVYLLTGGAGGLGMIFAKEIADKAKDPVLILTGRSPLSQEKQEQLKGLESLGAIAKYQQVDASQKESVEGLIEWIREDFGRLNGIIHSAGIIQDNFILKKSSKEFKTVLSPKVAGTVNLDLATRDMHLDFFILFSSGSGAMGNAGQADYSTANAFMDFYSTYRNDLVASGERWGQTLSINWYLWKEGGMRMDMETEKSLRQNLGMTAMETASGINAFYRGLMSSQNQILVIDGVLAKIREYLSKDKTKISLESPGLPRRQINGKEIQEKILDRLKIFLGEVTKLSVDRIESQEPLESYGIDSMMIIQLNQKLEDVFGAVSKTLFFEHLTLRSLADYLKEEYPQESMAWVGLGALTESELRQTEFLKPDKKLCRSLSSLKSTSRDQESIAIIGASGRYPQADNLDAFWMNLKNGKDCVTEIPKDRWPLEGFYHPDPKVAVAQGKSYSKWGGFIEDFASFDSLFFNIAPREAMGMDPQERLFLQTSYEALEDVGYTKETLKQKYGQRVGVFVGVTKTGFDLYTSELRNRKPSVYPHTSFSSIANRVSYFLDLKGPSMPIDTMCSSSLTAIHEACEHLLRDECELAIAGGVNLYLHPINYVKMSAAHMLAKGRKCRSFGKGADGFVPGEGVGAVILKPLSQAVEDRDHIYAVIRGTSVNHGGKTNGYTVPNPVAQSELIQKALTKAGVHGRTVSYIEAHGTGTELGDPIEVAGLTKAFGKYTSETGFCALGSIKSNCGHLEAAAGIAGLMKILLQLKHGQLVPSLHSAELNSNIDFENTPFVVQQKLEEWQRPVIEFDGVKREYPKIAGISSFGAGGANAHAVIEEYIEDRGQGSDAIMRMSEVDGSYLFVLSAKNEDRLRANIKQMVAFFDRILEGKNEDRKANMENITYTLQVGREALEERLGIIADSLEDLTNKLGRYLGRSSSEDWKDLKGFFRGHAKGAKNDVAVGHCHDMPEAPEQCRRNQDFASLLNNWVKGQNVDWEKLYGELKPRRISLPTYPFAGNRYWIDTDTDGQEKAFQQKGESSSPHVTAKKETLEDDYDEAFHVDLLGRILSQEVSIEEALKKIRN
jgi:acyl transferase domain-containing protein/thioesterase domain-containing protein/acyl carrier protein/N-acetylglutamate synthase-like GNAT family acetyltransferase